MQCKTAIMAILASYCVLSTLLIVALYTGSLIVPNLPTTLSVRSSEILLQPEAY